MTPEHRAAYRAAEDVVRQKLQEPAKAMKEREIYLHPDDLKASKPSAFLKIGERVYELPVNIIGGKP